jgi:MarR family 2-MHQ and catechol resistance regulon transcriptional repressor
MIIPIPREEVDQILFDTMKAIYRFERRKVQLFGINYEAFYLLHFLRRRSSARMYEIADEMNIHISTASRAVSRLEKRDFVSRKKDPTDKRHILVSLEPEGEKVVKKSEDHSFEIIQENLTNLDRETIQAIIATAIHFHQILQLPGCKSNAGDSADAPSDETGIP